MRMNWPLPVLVPKPSIDVTQTSGVTLIQQSGIDSLAEFVEEIKCLIAIVAISYIYFYI